jgi:hypothetical protein
MRVLLALVLVLLTAHGVAGEPDAPAPDGASPDSITTRIVGTFSGGSEESADKDEFPHSPRTHLNLLYDPGLTMRSGTENVISVHHAIAQLEDGLIGIRWFPEDDGLGKAGGVMGRITKYLFIDLPLDYFPTVFAHEYYGHGARYREQTWDKVVYAFDPPPPYGAGGGQAAGSTRLGLVSDHELLSVQSGGLEVQAVMNRNLALRWMAKRRIHYHEALVYFYSWQLAFEYIEGTKEDLEANESGHDVAQYLLWMNRHAGRTDMDSLLMDAEDLKMRNKINLVDPFLLYAIFTEVKTYLWEGDPQMSPPLIRIGGVAYLPSLRMGLTPFGPEYHLENFLRTDTRVALVDIRVGDGTFHSSWGGLGLLVQNVYGREDFSVDVNLDVWKQPEIEFGRDYVTSKGGGLGGAVSVRGYYDLTGSGYPVSAVIELGYKTPGFVEGYVLDSAPIIMVGLGFWN